MQTKKLFTALALMLVSVFALYAGTKVFRNGDKWVPADFDPKKTLLVQDIGTFQGMNEKMKTYMQEKYHYPYKFTSNTKKDNADYDVNTYPYALVWSFTTHPGDQFNSGPPQTNKYELMFYDRRTDKKLVKATIISMLPEYLKQGSILYWMKLLSGD